MVVLISNQTELDIVHELLSRLQGPRTLILEDVCGDALEALGSGCHGGGPQQSRCLAPAHAAWIARQGSGVRVAWRRHGSTRSIGHTAWAFAASFWGEGCSVWLADFRPEKACPGVQPLADVLGGGVVPGARLQLVKEPARLLGLPKEAVFARVSGEDEQADAGAASTFADQSFATRLAEYIDFHHRGVAALASDPDADVPVLVYSCQPYAQCGGQGDRLNGIVTAFLLAILTRRVFLIDSESPLPLQMLLVPRLVDWRVRGGLPATALLRQHHYHDKRRQFEADLGKLASYPDKTLVLTMNYRMLRVLFESSALRPEAPFTS
mmetsp:Transcript_89794/g.290103  ORF Transcript_89794/g.290103 Transcript_89794/m.290103 type:complete len:323 (+) Transcript_89794:1012-1980(+)